MELTRNVQNLKELIEAAGDFRRLARLDDIPLDSVSVTCTLYMADEELSDGSRVLNISIIHATPNGVEIY